MIPKLTGALTHNLSTKLLALLLALVVYAHVVTEEEQRSEIRVPVKVVGLSPSLVLASPPPSHAVLVARGKGKQVFKLRVEPPVLTVDLSGARPGKVQRMLSPGDVALPVGSTVTVSEILQPHMVEFDVDTVIVRSLPVVLVPVGTLPAGVAVVATSSIPLRVDVRGPSLGFRGVDRIAVPFRVDRLAGVPVTGGRGELDTELPVTTPRGLTVDPPQVRGRVVFTLAPSPAGPEKK
jgi:hypothetical protein